MPLPFITLSANTPRVIDVYYSAAILACIEFTDVCTDASDVTDSDYFYDV